MKKDINPSPIKDIAVAIAKEVNAINQEIWNVYLVNMTSEKIQQVLVSSRGYLKFENGEEKKTTTLRHALGDIDAMSYVKIEPIMEEVFGLHNEFWVSYFKNNELLDKKYIFLAETIKEENLITVPIIFKKGVMIK